MIDELRVEIQREIERAFRMRGVPQHGTVTSYDPKTYRAKVAIQPDNIESNWMPIKTVWAGNGWGFRAPPPAGTQVQVTFQEEDQDSPVISGFLYDDTNPAATGTLAQGEIEILHKTGSVLRLTNDGKVLVNGHVELDMTGPTIKITATTEVDVTAPAIKLGNGGTLTKLLMYAFKAFYNAHVHSGVTAGSSTSGPPQTPIDDSYFTSVVEAQ